METIEIFQENLKELMQDKNLVSVYPKLSAATKRRFAVGFTGDIFLSRRRLSNLRTISNVRRTTSSG